MPPFHTRGPYATQTAAGTTTADAASMNADTVMVTAGSNGAGIRVRLLNVNEEAVVCNGTSGTTAIDLLVYPRSGGSINNQTADTPLLLPAGKAAHFRAIDGAGNVIAFF